MTSMMLQNRLIASSLCQHLKHGSHSPGPAHSRAANPPQSFSLGGMAQRTSESHSHLGSLRV